MELEQVKEFVEKINSVPNINADEGLRSILADICTLTHSNINDYNTSDIKRSINSIIFWTVRDMLSSDDINDQENLSYIYSNISINCLELLPQGNSMYLERVNSLSDDEKINFLQHISDNRGKATVMKCIVDDDKKISALAYFNSNEKELGFRNRRRPGNPDNNALDKLKASVLVTLSSDDNKIKAISLLQNNSSKANLIASLSSDELKIKTLSLLQEDYNKVSVILSLSSDELKIEYLTLLQEDYRKARVIESLSSDENKIKALSLLQEDYNKVRVIESLSSDENKIKALSSLQNDLDKVHIIEKLTSNTNKIGALSLLQDDYSKSIVIESLSNDEDKIKYLALLQDDLNKARIIQTLSSDELKIEYLALLQDDYSKSIVIESLSNDETKIKHLALLQEDLNKARIIQTLSSDKLKIEYLTLLQDDYSKAGVIESLSSDELKIEYLTLLQDDKNKVHIIEKLTSDTGKIKALSLLQDDYSKSIVIESLSSDEDKIKYLALLQDDLNKARIIQTLSSDELKIEYLALLQNDYSKTRIISGLSNDKIKIDAIQQYLNNIESKRTVILSLNDDDMKIDALLTFCTNNQYTPDEISNKKVILLKLLESNQEVLETINVDFLGSNYIEIFGESNFEQIACYKDIQDKICYIGKDDDLDKLKIIKKCLDTYTKENGNSQWNILLSRLLDNLESDNFDKLLQSMKDNNIDVNNLSEKDIIALTNILSSPNIFNIETFDEVRHFELVKQSVLYAIINNDEEAIENYPAIKKLSTIDRKKLVILESLFGINLGEAREIIYKYGTDIDNITSKSTESQISVNYIHCLQLVLEESDERIIDSYIEETKDLDTAISQKDPIAMEGDLKATYFKEYKEKLFTLQNARKLEGKNMYDAGIDFNILLTSVKAYSGSYRAPSNFEESWNVKLRASQGICTSFISNEMMATAPVNYCCYGFCNIEEDSLMMSGWHDIHSYSGKFVPTSSGNEFLTPQEQINKTTDSWSHHNEMVVSRFNKDSSKVQPDYLVAFKKDGEILHEDYVMQAQEDFGGIPIVVIDVDKCLVNEEMKVLKLIKEYKETGSEEIRKQILQKVRNNEETVGSNAIGSKVDRSNPQFERKIISNLLGEGKESTRLEKILDNRQSISTTAIDSAIQTLEAKFAEFEANTKYADDSKDKETDIRKKSNVELQKSTSTVSEQSYSDSYQRTPTNKLYDALNTIRNVLGRIEEKRIENIEITMPDESRKAFETGVKAIASTSYYDKNEQHSIEHIEKVMLFSTLLAKNEGLNEEDTRLLIATAAFHDSFRNGQDGNGPHAEESAEVAKEYFENNPENPYVIKQEDIPLMQVAIAYHEYSEKPVGTVNRDQIKWLCNRYGFVGDIDRVVKITTILKDADALDRARFAEGGKLNPAYLRTKSGKSKKMIEYAYKVNNMYAKKMIDRNYGDSTITSESESVRILRENREKRNVDANSEPKKEETLSVDEMLSLFDEAEASYTEQELKRKQNSTSLD